MTRVRIDSRAVEVPEGTTILEAARGVGVGIPTLCHHEKLSHYGGCRICLVEVGREEAPERTRLMPACTTKAEQGMVVQTATDRVMNSRRFVLQLLISRSPDVEKLQEVSRALGASGEKGALDIVGEYLLKRAPRTETTRCIRCSLCVRVCAEIVEAHAISFEARGIKRKVTSPFRKISQTCIGCGACAYVCPAKTITIEEAPTR